MLTANKPEIFLEIHIFMIWISLNPFINLSKNYDPCPLTFYSLKNIIKVSAFMIISIFEQFLCPGRRNPVFSGCPVFQKVYIWNLHVMGNFWMQKFSRKKFVRDPVLPGNCHFQPFYLIRQICIYKTVRN